MDVVTEKIHLLIDGEIHAFDITKTIYGHDAKQDSDILRLSLRIGNAEYTSTKDFYNMEDAIVDLQKQLPGNTLIACCQTCKHGNYCPYGDQENEIFCLINYSLKDKRDVVDIFSADTRMQISLSEAEYAHVKLPANELLHLCDQYGRISHDDYTYNDWLYHFKNDGN